MMRREVLMKYFNKYLINIQRTKLSQEFALFDKFKEVFKNLEYNNEDYKKILELDDDKMSSLIKSLIKGNLNNDSVIQINNNGKLLKKFIKIFIALNKNEIIISDKNINVPVVDSLLVPIAHSIVDIPNLPGIMTIPSIPKVPGVPNISKVSDLPNKTQVPGVPKIPGIPGVPCIPNIPGIPGVPKIPGIPTVQGIPNIPGVPKIPGVLGIPGVPRIPGIPSISGVPGVPGVVGNGAILIQTLHQGKIYFTFFKKFLVHLVMYNLRDLTGM